MTITNRLMNNYGEAVTIGSNEGRGFISCLDPDDAQIHKTQLAPGVTNKSKYRLITDAEGISEGDCVTAAGRSYVVLRVESVRIFGAFSHNECILKLKGGGMNA
jgi:hypothetical protein